MRKLLFGIVFIIVLLLLAAGLATLRQNKEVSGEWETYTSEAYGFSVTHPADWVVFESSTDNFSPKINIYKQGSREGELPLTHFSNATHVSFYPLGIPTEGIVSLLEEVTPNVSFPVTNALQFIVENGAPFAEYINPRNPPRAWNEAGFVWGRVYMPNMKTVCRRGDVVIEDENSCDPFTGDSVVYVGSPDAALWQTVERIIESITFTDTAVVSGPATSHPLITVVTPAFGGMITSPLTVSGEARGQWYFEASFPVTLTDWDGRIIAQSFAMAEDEWMTTDFVPFKGTVEFESPATADDPDFMKNGTLIFSKDNPSGLPEHDDAFEIPVRFVE